MKAFSDYLPVDKEAQGSDDDLSNAIGDEACQKECLQVVLSCAAVNTVLQLKAKLVEHCGPTD